jgi:6-methylsalicylate decarboxylase
MRARGGALRSLAYARRLLRSNRADRGGEEPVTRIDVHAHYLPDEYRTAATAAGHAQPDGMPGLPEWSVASALEVMDANGIETAMLSVSSPGVYFGDEAAAAALARSVNEAGAAAVAAHPSRFGLFASVPLPDVDAALAEIEYALDSLDADGVVLMTNYDGVHLGDPKFDAVFNELNRRGAVVFMHPTSPVCAACGERGTLTEYPAPMLEFMFESTRTVAHLAMSGTFTRCPDLRFIVPHAGAALPLLSDRVAGFVSRPGMSELDGPEAFFDVLRRLYYDLAGYPVPKMLPALDAVAAPDRLLYGSDWPFTPASRVGRLASMIDESDTIEPANLERLMLTNARELFPRLTRQGQL